MDEIKTIWLREGDVDVLLRAAELFDRLGTEHAGDVVFDSADNYYVDCRDVAQRFRLLARLPHPFSPIEDTGPYVCSICNEYDEDNPVHSASQSPEPENSSTSQQKGKS